MFGFLRRNEHRVKDRLSLYLDGRLVPEEKAKVESHLKACAACREELESLRATVEALRRLPLVAPPRPFVLPVEGSRLAGAARPALRPVAFYRLRLATAVVAALLVALVSWDSMGQFMAPVAQEPLGAPAPAALPSAQQRTAEPTPSPAAAPAAQAPAATPPPLPTATPTPRPAAAPTPVPAPKAAPTPAPPDTSGQPRIMKAAPSGPVGDPARGAAATAQEAGGPVPPTAPPVDAGAAAQAMEQSRQVGTPQPAPATPPPAGVAPAPAQPVAPRSLPPQPSPTPPSPMPLAPPARDGAPGVAGVAPTPSPTLQVTQEETKAAPSRESSTDAMDAAQPPYGVGLGVREAETALGVLLVLLGAATIYAWRRARKQVKRKETR